MSVGIEKDVERKTKNKHRWLILFLVSLADLPVSLDMTILYVAIPTLTLALEASNNEILWILDIYPLVTAGLLIPMGTLADRVGSRRLLLTGIAVFVLFSISAAFAPNVAVLIMSRVGLALGASMIAPSVLALIRLSFDDFKERALALSIWTTIFAAGTATGPLLGGFLLEHFWWGAVFFINVPILVAVGAISIKILPRYKPKSKKNWPIWQAAILLSGLTATVYGIKAGIKQESFLGSEGVLLVAGIFTVIYLLYKQSKIDNPLLDLNLFKNRAIRMGLITALVASGTFAGIEFTLAQELQFAIGYSPLEAGIFMFPLMATAAVAGIFTGRLITQFSVRTVCSSALLVAALSLLSLGFTELHDNRFQASVYLSFLGAALSIGLTASSIMVMSNAPKEKAGEASSLESVGASLGTGFGITFFGLLLSALYRRTIIIPDIISSNVSVDVANSIGNTMVAAKALNAPMNGLLVEAGRLAFASSHSIVLIIGAIMLGLLAGVAYYQLRKT